MNKTVLDPQIYGRSYREVLVAIDFYDMLHKDAEIRKIHKRKLLEKAAKDYSEKVKRIEVEFDG